MTPKRYPFERVVLSYAAAIVALAVVMHVLAARSPFREWLMSGSGGTPATPPVATAVPVRAGTDVTTAR